ncbi:MAG: histidinol dehydrogenase [Phycisphaerae bacterium]
MRVIPIVRADQADGQEKLSQIKERLSLTPLLLAGLDATPESLCGQVRHIIADVHRRGDAAIVEYTRRFDHPTFALDDLRVPERQINVALTQADMKFIAALDMAIDNVRRYQQAMLAAAPAPIRPMGAGSEAAQLAVRYEPLKRVGIYVPGGAGAYPSTVVMSVVPAQVAGVESICICSPMRSGAISPAVLAAAGRLGIREIYAIGGPQAVAGMAFGTQRIPAVDKIVGPGNSYVQLAKKELFGIVDIDSFAGPSEVIVLADDTAEARVVAAELLAQAEHAPGSCLLITASLDLARRVQLELEAQVAVLPRRELTTKAIEYASALIVTTDMGAAIRLVNDFAPEHLQVTTYDSHDVVAKIRNAGAIFIGPHTPVAAGDYLAGPSHVLPTSGTARFFSGLSAENFRKRISLVELDAASLRLLGGAICDFAHTEGFDAHARAVQTRLKDKGAHDVVG